MNIGIPIDGPKPDGSGTDSVAYVGSKAHNRYDNKFYESMVDSIDTNKRQLGVVTKVVDMYDDKNPKTSYMKAVINDVPGKGIKITRYVADTAKNLKMMNNIYTVMQVMKSVQTEETVKEI